MQQEKGFTIMELMITLSILAVLVTIAVPGMNSYMDKHKLINATEAIYGQLVYARSEAISRSKNVAVRVVVEDDTTDWAIGVTTNATCDPTVASASAAGACVLSVSNTNVLKRIVSTDFPGVTLGDGSVDLTINYNPTRGTIGVGEDGTAIIRYGNYTLHVELDPLGRASICAPGSAGKGGYPAC